jgi:DNA polymerase I-like protein with 3'-5' exonuclease and polymerase domains
MRPKTTDAYKFFHRGTLALSQMERNGIRIDLKYLDSTIAKTEAQIAHLELGLDQHKTYRVWRKRFGDKMNLDSTQQLANVLFKVLGHKPSEYTDLTKDLDDDERVAKTDQYSLRHIQDQFIVDYFQIKKLKKVLGTYLRGIRREVCGELLHTSFNLAGGQTDDQKGGAASYRSSSSNPNLHNIPIRNKEMGDLIRPCFIPRRGRRLVERDFSGIEVRVSACYNKDPNLIRYIEDKTTDMHRDEASVLFIVSQKEMEAHKDHYKKTLRDAAKNMWVFPQFYGSVWFQCAPPIWEAMELRKFTLHDGTPLRKHLRRHGIKELGNCDPEKGEPESGTFAHHLMLAEKQLWNKRFPVYTRWKKDFYNKYLERGYFDLYTGFRCAGHFRRNQVINFPVQGAAFHCLLWTLIQVQNELVNRGLLSLLVSQIHDSMIADVCEDELQEYLDLTQEVAERKLPEAWKWINVPVETEVDVTPVNGSWVTKAEWSKNSKGVWTLKG